MGVAWSKTKPRSARSVETSKTRAPLRPFSSLTEKISSTTDGRALDRGPVGQREQHRHGGLVVGAEDRVARALPAAVDQHRLDDALVRDGVHVRAEHHGALRAAGDARQQVAALGAGLGGRAVLGRPRSRARAGRPPPARPPRASRPKGLGIAHSSANRSFSRRRSTSDAGRNAGGLSPPARRGPRRPRGRGPARAPARRRRTRGRAAPGARGAT